MPAISKVFKDCSNCGETKSVREYPKKGGKFRYLRLDDPNRYDAQCKDCKKPLYFKKLDPDYVPPKRRTKEEINQAKYLKRMKAARRAAGKKTSNRRNRVNVEISKQKRRARTRVESWKYLAANGCGNCSIRDPRLLDYNHKDPSEKRYTIGTLIRNGYGWTSPRLQEEISKCDILCSNCHRLHTAKQGKHHQAEELQELLLDLSKKYDFNI